MVLVSELQIARILSESRIPPVDVIEGKQIYSIESFNDLPPEEWTLDQVINWLKSIGLHECVNEFIKKKITGRVLITLTPADIKKHLNIDISLWEYLLVEIERLLQ